MITYRCVVMPRGSGQRQCDFDGQAAVFGIAGVDFAIMQQDCPFGDGQTEAMTATVAIPGFGDADKRFENITELVFGDTGAVIADADQAGLFVFFQ